MFPGEFLDRINHQSYIDASSLAEALQQPALVSVRINPAKWSTADLHYERVPWEPCGFYLRSRPLFTLDPLFHAGVYYPQEASGMFTGEVFRQISGGMHDLRVLDLCGAPGGKSTHLSAIIRENGFLVANEAIRSRAAVLAENITKWGMGNTIVAQNDPAAFASLGGFFDVIVVDAPCSGEGMFRDAVAVNEWSPGNARLCSERQRRIVMNVWPALKPGGILIYSTCTFNPAENEENILWLHGGTGAESVRINISAFSGIIGIDYHGITGYGFHPGRIRGDGFFIAVLRKQGEPTDRTLRIKGSEPRVPAKISSRVAELVSFDDERLIFSGNRIIALALNRDLFRHLADRLTVIKSGTMIGEMKNATFVPAHDLAMSVKQKPGSWPRYNASHDEAIAFLRLDDFRVRDTPPGRALVCYRDVPLGFINNLGKRANNGYPQAWRVRMGKRGIFEEIL